LPERLKDWSKVLYDLLVYHLLTGTLCPVSPKSNYFPQKNMIFSNNFSVGNRLSANTDFFIAKFPATELVRHVTTERMCASLSAGGFNTPAPAPPPALPT
jgi:hypothetical protein